MPTLKLSLFQKGVYYSGSKIFNHLPYFIKNLASNVKIFKTTLKNFLMTTSFYTVDEFLMDNIIDLLLHFNSLF
jgi:hypothetical protein